MSILIKGMEMPNACCDCDLLPAQIDWGEQWECPITEKIVHKYVEKRKGKPPDCPLVELPPHGRLIDADVFEEMLNSEGGVELKDVPTVIESEEQENE